MATKSNKFATKKEHNKNEYYGCKYCNYVCSKKYNWIRHLNTPKHLKLQSMAIGEKEIQEIPEIKGEKEINADEESEKEKDKEEKGLYFVCEQCDRMYSNRTSLWRHKKKCAESFANDKVHDSQILIECLLRENAEFKQLMIEQNKQLLEQNKHVVELAKTAGHNNNNNNNNNNFNLQFFLNETCKNAIDIMDFVGQLQVKTEDLEETGRLGFADGISKIFVNGLKQIHVSERPIHCSDVKREILYIKSNNEWSKEPDEKPLLMNAIRHVAHKNIRQISKWTETHPEFNDPASRENDKYLKIVSESMCGSTPEETNKNYHKIIKTIVKETAIDK
jgi:hypothetical protein